MNKNSQMYEKKYINKKGITFISVFTTIVIMLILLSTITFSLNGILNSTKKKEFANEIYTIQKMVEEYHFKNNKYPIKDTGTNEIDLYELGVSEVNRGLKKDGDDDIYVIDDTTGKISYKKGVKIDGKEYHSLEENEGELKKELGID